MRKRIAIVLAVVAVLAIAVAIGQYRQNNLDEYARRNNCTWSYYYDQPICK
jgi:hypothetical protein